MSQSANSTQILRIHDSTLYSFIWISLAWNYLIWIVKYHLGLILHSIYNSYRKIVGISIGPKLGFCYNFSNLLNLLLHLLVIYIHIKPPWTILNIIETYYRKLSVKQALLKYLRTQIVVRYIITDHSSVTRLNYYIFSTVEFRLLLRHIIYYSLDCWREFNHCNIFFNLILPVRILTKHLIYNLERSFIYKFIPILRFVLWVTCALTALRTTRHQSLDSGFLVYKTLAIER